LATVSKNGRALASAGPADSSLVMLADPHSPSAEAYRSLAANLQFAYADRQVQTIGLTSAAAGEGKSTTAANLALALAEGGRRVILIDADLRRPSLHTLLGANLEQGLSNVLLGGDLGTLPLQDTVARGVRLLSSGPTLANPLEALASRRFDQVLSMARAEADFVQARWPTRRSSPQDWKACFWSSAPGAPSETSPGVPASSSIA
jgi:Mrp family chromosome partitioning ATPase